MCKYTLHLSLRFDTDSIASIQDGNPISHRNCASWLLFNLWNRSGKWSLSLVRFLSQSTKLDVSNVYIIGLYKQSNSQRIYLQMAAQIMRNVKNTITTTEINMFRIFTWNDCVWATKLWIYFDGYILIWTNYYWLFFVKRLSAVYQFVS